MVSYTYAWQLWLPSAQLCAKRGLLELGPCSSQLALHVQKHELCVCPMLVLNAYLHPQNPQEPVFDLMCVPVSRKESAKQVRWLVQACCNRPCL